MFIEDLLTQLYNKSIDPELQPQIADLISVLVIERDAAIQKRGIDLMQQHHQIERMRKIAEVDDPIGACELVERLMTKLRTQS